MSRVGGTKHWDVETFLCCPVNLQSPLAQAFISERLQRLGSLSRINFVLAQCCLLFIGVSMSNFVLAIYFFISTPDGTDPFMMKGMEKSPHKSHISLFGSFWSMFDNLHEDPAERAQLSWAFHVVEFWSTFLFVLVEVSMLAFSPRSVGNIYKKPFVLKALISFNVVSSLMPAVLITYSLKHFETLGHELEYVNGLIIALIDAIIMNSRGSINQGGRVDYASEGFEGRFEQEDVVNDVIAAEISEQIATQITSSEQPFNSKTGNPGLQDIRSTKDTVRSSADKRSPLLSSENQNQDSSGALFRSGSPAKASLITRANPEGRERSSSISLTNPGCPDPCCSQNRPSSSPMSVCTTESNLDFIQSANSSANSSGINRTSNGVRFSFEASNIVDLPSNMNLRLNLNQEVQNQLNEVRRSRTKDKWMTFVISMCPILLAITQFTLYNMGKREELVAHFCEFSFNIVSAAISYIFCMDNKLLCDKSLRQLIGDWCHGRF